ncbi:MAG: hypothetical protein Q8N45_02480, partial [Anaerolineales bacterium]|nr:hypothetical protein [Anaerolineales bacterium]
MKIITNQKLIRRNARIGQVTSLAALAILGAGMYITFTMKDKVAYSMAALIIGFFLSQVGIYFGNRWGRRPRPDEVLDRSLKGLGREYTIYHYVTPVSHLLLGPAGLWTFTPYYQAGTITYQKGRWRVKGGGFAQSYLRIFGQENLGRPDLEAEAGVETLKRYLRRQLPEGAELPEIKTALLFTIPKAELKIEA